VANKTLEILHLKSEMQIMLIEAVEIQDILYLELSNATDFNRGCQNAKDFALRAGKFLRIPCGLDS
jgi:hypothetical protein